MASIELRTPKNKPAYYKITANITLNGRTIRKFSRFEFDPKTLKTAKQRAAAATAAAFEFEAKAQEEAERSLSGASKPFREVADEYIASTKAKLEPSALLRGNYDFDKNKANTSRNKIGYLKKMVDVAPWFVEKSISEITKEDCEKVIEAVKENGCVRSEYAVILPEYAAMKSTSYAAMVEGYDLSAYTAMKCFGGAAVTMKTAEEVSKFSAFPFVMRSALNAKKSLWLQRQFGNMCCSPTKCCTLQTSGIILYRLSSRSRKKEPALGL